MRRRGLLGRYAVAVAVVLAGGFPALVASAGSPRQPSLIPPVAYTAPTSTAVFGTTDGTPSLIPPVGFGG